MGDVGGCGRRTRSGIGSTNTVGNLVARRGERTRVDFARATMSDRRRDARPDGPAIFADDDDAARVADADFLWAVASKTDRRRVPGRRVQTGSRVGRRPARARRRRWVCSDTAGRRAWGSRSWISGRTTTWTSSPRTRRSCPKARPTRTWCRWRASSRASTPGRPGTKRFARRRGFERCASFVPAPIRVPAREPAGARASASRPVGKPLRC